MPFQGDEYLINSTTAGDQSHPTQTVLGNGDILVTWESQENSDFPNEIRARILNSDGTVNTPDFIVNTTAESQNEVTATTLPNGDALVAWSSTNLATNEDDIFARVVDAQGHLGPEFPVTSSVIDFEQSQSPASTATLADGNVLLVSSIVVDEFADGREIVGNLLGPDGHPIGSGFTIDAAFPENQFGPQVVAMPDGRAFLTWTVQNHGSGTMYGQFLLPDGSTDGSYFQISPPAGGFNADPTPLRNDNVLVTWDENDGIHGQIIDSHGAAVGSNFMVGDGAIESVTALSDGRALAIWWQGSDGPSGDGIYARVINADGSMSNPEFVVNSATDRSEFNPHVTELPNGQVFMTWTSASANGDSDIHGRVLTLDTSIAVSPANDVIHGTSGDDVIHGGDGNDVIFGEGGNDTLAGDTGHNQLWGNDGNDTFIGGVGTDSFAGGVGVDTVTYATSTAAVAVDLTLHTASGGDAAGDTPSSIENLTGSAFNDALTGDAGANHLDGGDGNDALTGHAGDDVLHGGAGNDIIWGNEGNDVLNGGAGADVLTGGTGTDTADYSDSSAGVTIDLALGTGSGGDAQGDKLSSIENVTGSAFNDHLTGNDFANDMSGGAGNDVINGGSANDTIHGGDGNDSVIGGDGNDTIYGEAGHNQLWGDDGNDTFIGGAGADDFAGGGGADTVTYDASHAGVTVDLAANTASGGDAAGDSFSSIENLTGSDFKDVLIGDASDNQFNGGDGNDALTGGSGNDVLHGDAGNDQIWGNDGNDILVGGAGADALNGGFGRDTADYSASAGAVNVDLALGTGSGGDAQGDKLSSIENITGTSSNDTLTGSNSANHLLGGDGNDRLDGGAGNDLLSGGHGLDALTGGSGADVFVFNSIQDSLPGHEDQIIDFSSIEHDQINLANIDANTHAAGNQDFTYIDGSAFTDTAGQLRFADHFLEGDVNGDGTADFRVHVNVASLAHGDFVL